MAPSWNVYGETKGAFGNLKQPDVIIIPPDAAQPVVIENEYSPAQNVDAEAIARLGETLDPSVVKGYRQNQRRHRPQIPRHPP